MNRNLEGAEIFADLALSRRLERAEGIHNAKFVEARARTMPEIGARWIEVAGAYAMYDGPDSPVTQTFGLGMFGPVSPADLDRIESLFQERGAPVYHEVSPMADPAVFAMLNERGYRPIEFTSVMFRPIRDQASPSRPAHSRVRARLMGVGEEGLWVEIASRGWAHIPGLPEYIRSMGPVCGTREGACSFLAELDGTAIAVAVLCMSDRVALLAGACTVPEGRNQGAQLALLERRLGHAAEVGCDIAMMCAAPGSASQRNAERHGFRIAYTRIKWRLDHRPR